MLEKLVRAKFGVQVGCWGSPSAQKSARGIPAGGATITQPQNHLFSHRRSLLGAPGSPQPWSGTAPTMSPFYSGNGRILAALFGCPWFRWLFGWPARPACRCEEGGREQRECSVGGWAIFNWGSLKTKEKLILGVVGVLSKLSAPLKGLGRRWVSSWAQSLHPFLLHVSKTCVPGKARSSLQPF